MDTFDEAVIIDNDFSRSKKFENRIKDAGFACKIKKTLNGGHALLYLNQMQENLKGKNLLILMNPLTPIMNGYDFLQYFDSKGINTYVIALTEGLGPEQVSKIKELGVSHFVKKDLTKKTMDSIVNKLRFQRNNGSEHDSKLSLKPERRQVYKLAASGF